MTNNMAERLVEHWIGRPGSFTSRYNVHYLVWYETTKYVLNAIDKEKLIKSFKREKKIALINDVNPKWKFYNLDFVGNWPPTQEQIETVKERWRNEEERGIKNWRP
jgi:putative endonuclease